ncbi:MAG: PAS domain S-box protein [Bradyrhizobium sp.]|uniref:PAS domain S-box protein n=1 Tax=Bradyrhizobium sp. TaxID=376 RepID=UPI001D415998|nr:PAS domain S-box protein [Bradyrhizobium sp.]MBV9559769.1 PAS domain S-box protein [Bradyrhizobium sp.]
MVERDEGTSKSKRPKASTFRSDADPFVAAVRATRMPMVITDPNRHDNPIIFANDAFCSLTGYEEDELLGRNCRVLQGPETDPDHVSQIREAIESLRPIEIDICNYRKDGSKFWNRILLSPVNDADGNVAYFFGQLDVTFGQDRLAALEGENAILAAERRANQARLEFSEESLRLATEAAEIGTWDLDLTTDVLTWSERTKGMFGISPNVVCSMADFYAGLHPNDVEKTSKAFASALNPEQHAVYDVEYRTIGKEDGVIRWVAAKGKGVFDASGRCIRALGTAIDITERKITEARLLKSEATLREWAETLEARVAERTKELEEAQEVLRQSQKMEAVGQLTGGLAHDFNNLLAVIGGSLELLDRRLKQRRTDELERFVTAAQSATKRASALTHRLLAFSRRQTLDPKPTLVNKLIGGLDELIRRTVGPSIAVEVAFEAGLWLTLVDPPQLENALLNLCINARDAMPDGGRLTIETGNRWLDERAARERDIPSGQYISLCVSDTGTGMSPDIVARAFEPFFTTKPTGQGTGLGLSMIYGFARQSGGQVRIYSELGKGTAVCLYLPRYQGEDIEEKSRLDSATPHAKGGATVLVVDDEAAIRMLVIEMLTELDYIVLEAVDGPSAMKILQSDRAIDLLVTDVGLPNGMNGRQIADAARGVRPGLKVLFMTGYAENAAVSPGYLEPDMAVITKPFDVDSFAQRVTAIIGQNKIDSARQLAGSG